MQFGHFCLPSYDPQRDGTQEQYMLRLVDFLAESEDRGFDAIWANEHHFHPFGGMLPSPPIMLAAMAQRTRRVRLGTSVICLPLHNPVEIAEQLAMVDLMSGGRVELGVGRGFVLHDYHVLGLPTEDAQQRMLEALQVITKAWSGKPFTHEGTHYHFPVEVEVWPQPLQRPHPPLWMAATGDPRSFAYAGEHGYNLLTVAWVKPLAQLADLVGTYRSALKGQSTSVGVHFQVVVSEDGEEARWLMLDALTRYIASQNVARTQSQGGRVHAAAGSPQNALDVPGLVAEGRLLAGTPEEVVSQLQMAQQTVTMDLVDCNFYFGGLPFDAAQRSLRLFGEQVIPHFKRQDTVAEPRVLTAISG